MWTGYAVSTLLISQAEDPRINTLAEVILMDEMERAIQRAFIKEAKQMERELSRTAYGTPSIRVMDKMRKAVGRDIEEYEHRRTGKSPGYNAQNKKS